MTNIQYARLRKDYSGKISIPISWIIDLTMTESLAESILRETVKEESETARQNYLSAINFNSDSI